MMVFARRPTIHWGPLPAYRRRHNRCGRCGAKDPRLFHVANRVWAFYVPPEQRRQILCLRCWDWLANAIDGGAYWRAHWEPGSLGAPVSRWHGTPEAEAPRP